jgi:hypothetical protein
VNACVGGEMPVVVLGTRALFGGLWTESLLRSGRGAGGTREELEGMLSTSTSIGTSVGVWACAWE